ncbi:MAG TPA: tetratricopeptide repeat protein, partial [Acidimicrobiales bacterium]|nr:tetratricopeptide repeat protein [Acidimicrobiales bacterium]
AFDDAHQAVQAAVRAQQDLSGAQWPEGIAVRVRMALHSGTCDERDGDYFGPTVNRVARLEAVAHGGQIVLSGVTAEVVRSQLPNGASLLDLGEHRLKDLGQPEHVYQLAARGSDQQFPPLRSLDNPVLRNNLPAQLATFIGRGRELAELRRMVESDRLVTVTGAGGSGKTRLALQVAADVLDGYADGVWLVELATTLDGGDVPRTVSDVLGFTIRPGQPVIEELVDALVPQQVLVVLDNCEHLIDACAQVAVAILRRCRNVHVLVTSREPLGTPGETIYRVPSLSLPEGNDLSDLEGSDAMALFVERARSQGVEPIVDESTASLLRSVCRRLDGMPLAIELAAARTRSLSLADVHDLLDQRFRLLTGGNRGALERQQTLRATVDWSYRLLKPAEQSILRRLSVFAEDFDVEAARRTCSLDDIEPFDVTTVLGSLVDKSLVVAEPSGGAIRYRLLETIRQFAAEHLAEREPGEPAAVAEAHCRHFLALCESVAPGLLEPDQGACLARLDIEFANIRRAIEHTVADPALTTLTLRFAVALSSFWRMRSRTREGFSLFRPVLERPEATVEPRLYLGALIATAINARPVDIQAALELAERADDVARTLDDQAISTLASVVLGATRYFAGDPEGGYALGQANLERARALGDDTVLAMTLGLCIMASEAVDSTRTDAFFAEEIACLERSGNLFFMTDVRNTAGVHALHRGDIAMARQHLETAARVVDALQLQMYHVRINLGLVAREEGDLPVAISLLNEALQISRRSGDRFGLAYSVLGLATVAVDLADWERAAELHGVAQNFLNEIGQPWLLYYGPLRDASLGTLRAHLGEDRFQLLYDKGVAASHAAAVAIALTHGTDIGTVDASAPITR